MATQPADPGGGDAHARATIAGVAVLPLKEVVNERGGLLEIQRRDDPGFPGFGQAYVTTTHAGVIKAWYRHRRQTDQIAAVAGTLKLVLFDDRADSGTTGAVMEIILAARSRALVRIPPGVWHGFQAMGDEPALLVHLNTEPFDFDATDEERLPVDDPQIPYSW